MERSWPVEVHGGDYAARNILLAVFVVLLTIGTALPLWLLLGMPRDFTIPLIWAAVAFPVGCVLAYQAIRYSLARTAARLPPVKIRDDRLIVPWNKTVFRYSIGPDLEARIGWFDSSRVRRAAGQRHPYMSQSLNMLLNGAAGEVLLRDRYDSGQAEQRGFPFGLPGPGDRPIVLLKAEQIMEIYDVLLDTGTRIHPLP